MTKEPIHPYTVYNTQQAADLLDVDPITIQRYIRSGKLVATKLGKNYRITGQALLSLMALDSDSIKLSQDRIKQIEHATYIKSKTFLLHDIKGEQFLRLIDLTNNALIATWNPDFNNNTENELTIKYIGSRVFNAGISALHDCLSGYYQVSFSIQRDLIEIQFLLDLFRTYPEKIKEWREANDSKLKKDFGPASVRDLLDERDKFSEKKRASRYQLYCKYATHMTYAGFTLITDDTNQVELGPFYNERKLLNCMHDLALNYGFAAMSFIANIKSSSVQAQKLAIEHMKLFHEVFKDKLPIDSKKLEELEKLHKIYSQILR